MISISIIIPTIGRDSLEIVLAQLVTQLEPQDEVLVVSDGRFRKRPAVNDVRVKYHESPRTNKWGNYQRNVGVRLARGTHLMFLDDDDEILPAALDTVRRVAYDEPSRISLFRMMHQGAPMWTTRAIEIGNISTQMFLIPNVIGRVGTWTERYEGDFDFLKSTLELYPEDERKVLWREEVTTIHGQPLDMGRFVKWPSLSLIVPTIGRPLLKRLLEQVLSQLWTKDEVLVVGDGPQPKAQAMVEGMDPRITYHELGPTRCWGHHQRNWAMLIAKGSHMMFLDDDDESCAGSFNVIREVAARNPEKILIFKTLHQWSPIWADPVLRLTNVSTQCFVVPNIPERFGTWGQRYAGDFDFITSSVAAHPEKENGVIWRPEIISIHGEPPSA